MLCVYAKIYEQNNLMALVSLSLNALPCLIRYVDECFSTYLNERDLLASRTYGTSKHDDHHRLIRNVDMRMQWKPLKREFNLKTCLSLVTKALLWLFFGLFNVVIAFLLKKKAIQWWMHRSTKISMWIYGTAHDNVNHENISDKC